jgi:2-keto-4-pentenoate hydratase
VSSDAAMPNDTKASISSAVRALVQARQSGRCAAAVPLPDAASAYAVQDGVAHALGGFGGGAPRHWKSGGPSRDAVLTHAPLPPAGVWTSPADARGWSFRLRGIEAELALRLGRDVDAAMAAPLDVAVARNLIDAICVSIEVVDSRWTEGLDAPALAKLADLQSHGALVLSEWVPFMGHDWAMQVCRVSIGHAPVVERSGSHAMGDPAFVLPAWLRHATRDGRRVHAGTVVTTGTWCGILHAAAGDVVSAEFPGIGQAVLQF